jgi:ADP-ribose pyrophosphatase YjhB (NUDIX family)
MEYVNINIQNDYFDEKIIISKNNYYCKNCNKRGHLFKYCNEPIISNGIICIYVPGFSKESITSLEEYLSIQINNNIIDHSIKSEDINIENIDYDINFLIVQRKHSLGYLEIMRGRYDYNNIGMIKHLLEQTTPDEITNINNKDFDYLWDDLWDNNNIKNKNHQKEYYISKQKFCLLKTNYKYLLENFNPLYKFNEWGFPKGRRDTYESDLVCAMREFEEETNYTEDMYNVFEKIGSIQENLVGTNGINYVHNYFLGLIYDNDQLDTKLKIDINNKEIGDVRIVNIKECINLIRPYHFSKINIIKMIYNLIITYKSLKV